MNAILVEIGRLICEVRTQLGISQGELAEMLGYKRTSITNIEAGRQNFTIETLYELAAALRVDVYELLPVEPANIERLTRLREINKQIQALREEAKALRKDRLNGGQATEKEAQS